MLGSIGSQLGVFQLGSVPSSPATEGVTGTGAIEIGAPAIVGLGIVGEVSRAVSQPPILVRKRAVTGRGLIAVPVPRLRATGLVIGGVGAVSVASPALIGRAGLALKGYGEVGVLASMMDGLGDVVTPRPRLRSGPPRESVVIQQPVRVRQKIGINPDQAWRDLQREEDEDEALMVLLDG